MLGDEHTCVKKRMFWAPGSSRTMSFGDKTASWPTQRSLVSSSVDRTGYLVPEVMPTPMGISSSYASAQEDRILPLGHPDPDHPPSSPPHYHGRASLAEGKPALANRSSWCVLDGDPTGKGETPRWIGAYRRDRSAWPWPLGGPPSMHLVGPDGACCVFPQGMTREPCRMRSGVRPTRLGVSRVTCPAAGDS